MGNDGTGFLSDEYFNEIDRLYTQVKDENNVWGFDKSDELAARAVLERMMDDLESNRNTLSISHENFEQYFDYFNRNVKKLDAILKKKSNWIITDTTISKRIHFFRNILNTYSNAPTNLDDMIDLAARGEWKLVKRSLSQYHMYDYNGINGELNVKFMSKDGKFEAVYNTGTEEIVTDSANMGTYNYGSLLQHMIHDVNPWKKWGNTDDLSYEEILRLDSKWDTKGAKENWNKIDNLIKSRK